jgi:Holliday junction resolvasome RuvABC endonuclease subunit
MTAFVGVDYSTRKVALVGLEDGFDPVVLSYQSPKKLTGMEATRDMLQVFESWCINTIVLDARVFIESPIMGRMLNAQTAVGMGIAAGALMQSCTHYGAATTEFVAPSFWKKRITGNGGLDKVGVSEWLAVSEPGLSDYCKNDDEVDAMCMALLSRQTAEAGM